MRPTSSTKPATALAALLTISNAFPANAASGAMRPQVLAFWVDTCFLLAFCVVFISRAVLVARNRDKGSTHVGGIPADRKVVRTCVTIMWSCVAVAWAAIVATVVYRPVIQPGLIQAGLTNISIVPFNMTLIALLYSIRNSWLHPHRMLMIGVVLVTTFGLAASLLTAYAYAWIAPL